jgi:hypothetical protein
MANKSAKTRFVPGDAVRAVFGVSDPDFPDIPLGGWAGKITEVEAGTPPTKKCGSGRMISNPILAVPWF